MLAELYSSGIIELRMRVSVTVMMTVLLAGCGPSESQEQRHKEAATIPGKLGQAAYSAAKVTGKAAKAAGHELGKAAHDAHEGWKDAAQKDKAKQR